MTDQIREYYLTYKLVFEESFSKSLDQFDMGAIHKMRTSTKRLRALFQLLESLSDQKFKAKRQLKAIRHLSKLTGKIRELQIELQLFSNYENTTKIEIIAYREYLSHKEHLEIARFLKSLPPLDKRQNILNDKRVLKALKRISKNNQSSKAPVFINEKLADLEYINRKKISNQLVHQNRTILKQLYYMYDILMVANNGKQPMEITKERLRDIEQQIGDWHDRVNSIHYINAFLKTKQSINNPAIKHYKQKTKLERDEMRKAIVKTLVREGFMGK